MPGNIGLPEILVVLVIALIIFGPKRLPELGRSVGKGIREFRSSISGNDDDDDEEESAAKPAQIEGAEQRAEPVETEVVADRHS
jgi:sec-independent protein translocase protein TatA